jgi:hypothetical protein
MSNRARECLVPEVHYDVALRLRDSNHDLRGSKQALPHCHVLDRAE